jgi:hypothetical protein
MRSRTIHYSHELTANDIKTLLRCIRLVFKHFGRYIEITEWSELIGSESRSGVVMFQCFDKGRGPPILHSDRKSFVIKDMYNDDCILLILVVACLSITRIPKGEGEVWDVVKTLIDDDRIKRAFESLDIN